MVLHFLQLYFDFRSLPGARFRRSDGDYDGAAALEDWPRSGRVAGTVVEASSDGPEYSGIEVEPKKRRWRGKPSSPDLWALDGSIGAASILRFIGNISTGGRINPDCHFGSAAYSLERGAFRESSVRSRGFDRGQRDRPEVDRLELRTKG